MILRVAEDEMKTAQVAREIANILERQSETFNLNDFLAELAEATGVLVQFKSMVPEWRATYDE